MTDHPRPAVLQFSMNEREVQHELQADPAEIRTEFSTDYNKLRINRLQSSVSSDRHTGSPKLSQIIAESDERTEIIRYLCNKLFNQDKQE